MPANADHHTTIVSVTGKDHGHLHVLANLSPPAADDESMWSVVAGVAHRPQVQWTRLNRVESWLTSMDETPSEKLFAVSMEGRLHYIDKGSWTAKNVGCPDGLNAIWAASDQDLFAVGLAGWRVRITDMVPHVDRDAKRRRLNAVHGTTSNNVYAAGDDGVIFHYSGSAWTEVESPAESSWASVLCHGKDVYVGGADGMVFRKSGDTWNPLNTPKDLVISSLAWYDNTVFAAAGLKGIYRLGPHGFESFKQQTIYRLKPVDDVLFGFGNRLLIQYDRSAWWGGELDL